MKDNSEPRLLASNLSQLDATMFTALLTDASIPWFIKDIGTGGYMKLYMGYTIYGQDIYVGSEDYDRAKELYDYYRNSDHSLDAEQPTFADQEENDSSDTTEHPHTSKGGTVARIIILISLLSILGAWLINRY